ncbi:energy transducer TonB [Parabacteroides sp. PF5-6]|uniref:energy transducer TonB n=1 Tax=Parabacteroides sp. PF5-6 TaxID=1742403 RepID=UPI002404C5FD|nr:energy transducer TonB [Parabacteroides sp. PF5-6]MDF9829676.1 hypothetical protein [Parabacteroides sp. PF5-6]
MRIRRYIQGHRRGRKANRLERDAMRDPFLAEALEGYERAKEDPTPHINILRRKIRSRNQRRLDVFKYGGLAASLVFILGFGIYFGFHKGGSLPEQKPLNRMMIEESQAADPQESQIEPAAGFEAYIKYVEKEMKRPTDACKDAQGQVTVSFFVDPAGKPYDIRVTRSLCPSNDREAMRLIREGPRWTPTDEEVSYTIEFD